MGQRKENGDRGRHKEKQGRTGWRENKAIIGQSGVCDLITNETGTIMGKCSCTRTHCKHENNTLLKRQPPAYVKQIYLGFSNFKKIQTQTYM